jgi:hypothetical protein
MDDYGFHDRQALIENTPSNRHAEKVNLALAALGERYVFHPANRVKRAPHKEPEIAKADVTRTIRRYLKRVEAQA